MYPPLGGSTYLTFFAPAPNISLASIAADFVIVLVAPKAFFMFGSSLPVLAKFKSFESSPEYRGLTVSSIPLTFGTDFFM